MTVTTVFVQSPEAGKRLRSGRVCVVAVWLLAFGAGNAGVASAQVPGAALQPSSSQPFASQTSASKPAAAQPLPLNSERIEARFGSYGIEVLYSDDDLRVSNLYSTHDGERVTRTFAVTRYPRTIDARIADAAAEILSGGSIGAVFKRRGWEVRKRHLSYTAIEIGADLAERMHVSTGTRAAVHVYVLEVVRGDDEVTYAMIAEAHHPEYLEREALQHLYGPPAMASRELSEDSDRLIAILARLAL